MNLKTVVLMGKFKSYKNYNSNVKDSFKYYTSMTIKSNVKYKKKLDLEILEKI